MQDYPSTLPCLLRFQKKTKQRKRVGIGLTSWAPNYANLQGEKKATVVELDQVANPACLQAQEVSNLHYVLASKK